MGAENDAVTIDITDVKTLDVVSPTPNEHVAPTIAGTRRLILPLYSFLNFIPANPTDDVAEMNCSTNEIYILGRNSCKSSYLAELDLQRLAYLAGYKLLGQRI